MPKFHVKIYRVQVTIYTMIKGIWFIYIKFHLVKETIHMKINYGKST